MLVSMDVALLSRLRSPLPYGISSCSSTNISRGSLMSGLGSSRANWALGAQLVSKASQRLTHSRSFAMVSRAFVGQLEANHQEVAFPAPVEYAQLLGLQGREIVQDSQILSAYEELAAAPLESGFSKRVEEGRLVLLHAAVDGLRKLRTTRDRDRLALQEVRQALLQWWLLPAALSLLQETGQPELVLELGSLALEMRESREHRRDILLSMALAHCSLSSDAFAAKDKVGLGCAHLEEALSLLDDAGFSTSISKLAGDIQQGLLELKPHCVLEHLKLPLDPERARTRKQALNVLKSLLANPEMAAKSDGTSGVDSTFLRKALSELTSAEVVQLLDWQDLARNTTSVPWYSEGLLASAGVAHIAAGFAQRRPAYIVTAFSLLRAKSKGSDVLVERMIACVLMGDPQSASHLLLEAERRGYFRQEATLADAVKDGALAVSGSSAEALPSRSEVLAFIRANSPDGDYDLLPGLCLFTERWLAKVALPHFKDLAGGQISPSLSAYFENDRVTSYLAVKSKDNDSWRDGLMVLTDNLASSLQRLRDPPLSARNARRHKAIELPRLALPESAAGSRRPRSSQLQIPLSLPRLSGRQLGLIVLLLGAGSLAAVNRSSDKAPPRAIPTATTAAALPAPARASSAAVPQQQSQAQLWRWKAPWQNRQQAEIKLHPRAAEGVIRRWQVAKAAAMGPRHDESMLQQAVAEPYLSDVRRDAAAARKAGWFWSYRLTDLHVENVDNSKLTEAGGEAVVTAQLREKGELFAVSGKRADAHCYSNPYKAEYRMVRLPEGLAHQQCARAGGALMAQR